MLVTTVRLTGRAHGVQTVKAENSRPHRNPATAPSRAVRAAMRSVLAWPGRSSHMWGQTATGSRPYLSTGRLSPARRMLPTRVGM